MTLLGDAEHKEDVLMLTKNLFSQAGSILIAPRFPGAVGGVPVRTFDARWIHTIGRGHGEDVVRLSELHLRLAGALQVEPDGDLGRLGLWVPQLLVLLLHKLLLASQLLQQHLPGAGGSTREGCAPECALAAAGAAWPL